ncbi:MAG TPA: hypothetical protein VNR36_12870 [Pseudolysinimonas sp.]|nr:hypothetical protein [Pseudolysinimonas sp.]
MSTLRSPVGPQPPSVYWRRRIFALLGLIAVIVVIVLIVSSLTSGAPSGDDTPKPTDTTAAEPSGTPTPTYTDATGGTACNPAQITLMAVTDSNSYASGVKPKVSMKITNAGSAPCTLDVNPATQEYLITSGSDRIWSSKDCQSEGAPTPVVLAPGVTQQTEPIEWDRTRSSTSTCTGSRPAAVANSDGPTYRLEVKLGEIESEPVAFRLF